MSFILNSVWKKVKIPFTNLGGFAILVLGILIMAAGIGAAYWMISKMVLLSIIISAVCGCVAGLVIAWAVRCFDFKSSSRELEKKLEEEQRKNQELSEANAKLQHSLETSPNITRIQPVMKLVLGEVSFNGTDYYEKPLGSEKEDE